MRSVSRSPESGIDPEAAGARFEETSGRELEPGATLVAYRLGERSFEVAVLRQAAGRFAAAAADLTDEIGGREFDVLLLAYLSGRHRDADPEFWDRVDDPSGPNDAELRSALLDQISASRERLAEQSEAVIDVPAADLELLLTREELESSARELVENTVDFVEEVLAEAGVAPDEVEGLLLLGAASRAPLVASVLHRRLGVEPLLPDWPEAALDEVPAPAIEATAPIPRQSSESFLRRPTFLRASVLGSILLLFVTALAAFGTRLGDTDPPSTEAGAPDTLPDSEEASSSADGPDSPTPNESDSGQGGSEEESETPVPDPDAGSGVPTAGQNPDPTPSDKADPTTESASTGKVPEVVGMSTSEARQALADAGYADIEHESEWRSVLDFSHDDCEVIEQDPPQGTRHPHSKQITITYSYSGNDSSECEE